ncbi:MAG: hypothetical protein GOV01_03125 [Candidatus Altiarchaeota archaeon]|nr:hypothetical protein [Candidatus Altiarchaeota archaeon]
MSVGSGAVVGMSTTSILDESTLDALQKYLVTPEPTKMADLETYKYPFSNFKIFYKDLLEKFSDIDGFDTAEFDLDATRGVNYQIKGLITDLFKIPPSKFSFDEGGNLVEEGGENEIMKSLLWYGAGNEAIKKMYQELSNSFSDFPDNLKDSELEGLRRIGLARSVANYISETWSNGVAENIVSNLGESELKEIGSELFTALEESEGDSKSYDTLKEGVFRGRNRMKDLFKDLYTGKKVKIKGAGPIYGAKFSDAGVFESLIEARNKDASLQAFKEYSVTNQELSIGGKLIDGFTGDKTIVRIMYDKKSKPELIGNSTAMIKFGLKKGSKVQLFSKTGENYSLMGDMVSITEDEESRVILDGPEEIPHTIETYKGAIKNLIKNYLDASAFSYLNGGALDIEDKVVKGVKRGTIRRAFAGKGGYVAPGVTGAVAGAVTATAYGAPAITTLSAAALLPFTLPISGGLVFGLAGWKALKKAYGSAKDKYIGWKNSDLMDRYHAFNRRSDDSATETTAEV